MQRENQNFFKILFWILGILLFSSGNLWGDFSFSFRYAIAGMGLYDDEKEDYTKSFTDIDSAGTGSINFSIEDSSLLIKIKDLEYSMIVDAFDEDKNRDDENVIIFTLHDADNARYFLICAPRYINFAKFEEWKINLGGVKILNSTKPAKDEKSTAQGSAVAIAPDILITNSHVIKDLSSVAIYLNGKYIPTDGFSKIAELSNDVLDLAILKVNGVTLNSCPISNEQPKLGSEILVYGYPQIELQGMELKVTKGIVSGKNGLLGDKSTFQMDAAIQPGNSGGPIVYNGKILGLATLMLINSQNVNVGIKATKIRNFLEFYEVTPKATTNDFEKCTYLLIGEK